MRDWLLLWSIGRSIAPDALFERATRDERRWAYMEGLKGVEFVSEHFRRPGHRTGLSSEGW